MADIDQRAGFLHRYLISTFSSLQHRNFRIYSLGVLFSLIGSLLQEVVIAWIAYEMTGSSLILGGVLFAYQVPMILMGALGGLAADKFDRRKILLVSQSLAFALSLVWIALSATGTLAIWHIYLLSSCFGAIVAFEIPARFAMIPQLVPKGDMINAFSLDSLLFYGGRVIGPAVGALLLALTGPTFCFVANSLSYVLELATLRKLKPHGREANEKVPLKEAVRAIATNSKTRSVLLFTATLTFFGVYIPLMPVLTKALEGGVKLNGLLIAISEMGAMIGAIYLANRTASKTTNDEEERASKVRRTIGFAGVAFALLLVAFGLAPNQFVALALVAPIGFSMTLVTIGAHGLLQAEVDDRLRGVASTIFWMYCYFGMLALGGPFMGYLVERIGVAASFAIAGSACLLSAVRFLTTNHSRRPPAGLR